MIRHSPSRPGVSGRRRHYAAGRQCTLTERRACSPAAPAITTTRAVRGDDRGAPVIGRRRRRSRSSAARCSTRRRRTRAPTDALAASLGARRIGELMRAWVADQMAGSVVDRLRPSWSSIKTAARGPRAMLLQGRCAASRRKSADRVAGKRSRRAIFCAASASAARRAAISSRWSCAPRQSCADRGRGARSTPWPRRSSQGRLAVPTAYTGEAIRNPNSISPLELPQTPAADPRATSAGLPATSGLAAVPRRADTAECPIFCSNCSPRKSPRACRRARPRI